MSDTTDDRPRRADFSHFHPIATRWIDNDAYGHINNVVYYAYFDTVVNRYLIDEGGLDYHHDDVVGVVAENGCKYFASMAYPEMIDAGLRVTRLGRRSVVYQVALFRGNSEDLTAIGHFVHVFVARATMRPEPMPDRIRAALERLVTPA